MAAARLVTPILVKMLLRWRATVFWLTTSSAAIASFVAPVATNQSTSTSRPVSAPLDRLTDPGTELPDGSEIGVGAERPEDPLGNVERGVAAVVLVQCTAGPGVEQVRQADLVGAAEVLPGADRCGGAPD